MQVTIDLGYMQVLELALRLALECPHSSEEEIQLQEEFRKLFNNRRNWTTS